MMTGGKINAILYCQMLVPMAMVIKPASTNPPGQPACRIFSHFVFSRENNVATTGLMTASTVPFPKAKIKLPKYSIQ